jgi:hypothetical protein
LAFAVVAEKGLTLLRIGVALCLDADARHGPSEGLVAEIVRLLRAPESLKAEVGAIVAVGR